MDKQPLSDLACLVPASRPIMVRQPYLGCLENAKCQCLATAPSLCRFGNRAANLQCCFAKQIAAEKKLLPNCRRGTSTPMQRCGWPSARTAWETRVIVGITCMPLHVGLYCTLCRWAGGKGDMLERVSSHTIPLPYCVPRRIRQLLNYILEEGPHLLSHVLGSVFKIPGRVQELSMPQISVLWVQKSMSQLLQPGG